MTGTGVGTDFSKPTDGEKWLFLGVSPRGPAGTGESESETEGGPDAVGRPSGVPKYGCLVERFEKAKRTAPD